MILELLRPNTVMTSFNRLSPYIKLTPICSFLFVCIFHVCTTFTSRPWKQNTPHTHTKEQVRNRQLKKKNLPICVGNDPIGHKFLVWSFLTIRWFLWFTHLYKTFFYSPQHTFASVGHIILTLTWINLNRDSTHHKSVYLLCGQTK